MQILMLNYEYPPLGGGAGRISMHISEELVKLGHNVTVVTTWYKGLPEKEEQSNKPTIVRLTSCRKSIYQSNPIEMYLWIKKSWNYLKTQPLSKQYDLCFANFTMPGGWLAQKIYKKFGIPYCIISHGHDIPWFYKKQMFWYHLIFYFKIKSICNDAKLLFVQSNEMKKNAEIFIGKSNIPKIIKIPNGIIPQKINTSYRRNHPLTILFVGRLVKQKDPITFIRALCRLSKMQIHYQAFIIGEGKLRKKIEKLIVKLKLHHVKLLGWLPNHEVWKYYEQSHIMIMPSLAEGMSISNIEALSAGIYLITTPVSGNKELIESFNNGTLVNIKNYREIANIVQKFYFEQYLQQKFIAEQVMNNFIEQFHWSTIAKQYESHLLTIIKN